MKEVRVEIKKDPLAYKVHQLEGGSIATFDGWRIVPAGGDGNWTVVDTAPAGKENDFVLRVVIGTPSAHELDSIFTAGPQLVQQSYPMFRRAGEGKKCTFGGDEAMIEEYAADIQGRSIKMRVAYIRKKDVAVAIAAIGTEDGHKEYGRTLEIVAQSITFKESPLEPGLVGSWALEKYYSSGAGTSSQFSHSSSTVITIYPNSTFTEQRNSSSSLNNNSGSTSAYLDGGNRGKIVKRGTMLTFHYDDGKVWNAEYKLDGGQGLWLNKSCWFRQ